MKTMRKSVGAADSSNFHRSKQEEMSHETSVRNGFTPEMMTDANALATEPTPAEIETAATQSNAQDYFNYYDPSSYQNYYYQDNDGNYYYYTEPQQYESNEALQDINVNVTPTPQNLVRSYEYGLYDPPTVNWFADIVIDTFFSKPFRVYLTILLYCVAVFMGALGLNYSFAIMYRMFSPPDPNANKNMQPFAYLAMFFYFSFVMVTMFCTLMDMVRNLWIVTRNDAVFWGMSHQFVSKRQSPYLVYLVVIISTVFLPVLWAIIETPTEGQSIVFLAQRYANISVVTASFLVVICYVWFYWKALVYKWSAISKRTGRGSFETRRHDSNNHPEKISKVHWYHASTVLEEFGVDRDTLLYNSIVFTVGCVPLFALYAAQTLSTYPGTPSVVWPGIASISLMCIYLLSWMTVLRRNSQWITYSSFALITMLFVLGLAGGGISHPPGAAAVTACLFLASHCMLCRKRKHVLSKRELCAALRLPYDVNADEERQQRPKFDTYLLCCRNVILNYMKCFDVKRLCGYRHPDVVEAERRFMIKHIGLRTDQKALLVWWIIVILAVAFVMALSNSIQYRFTTPIAVSTGTPVTGKTPSLLLCKRVFNAYGDAPLTMLDLGFLATLSYTFGNNGDIDFTTWFATKPSLLRIYPVALPPTLNLATDGTNISFSDYVDLSSNYHVITLNSNSRGLSFFRDLDDWGESIALQVAGAISPLINIWDERSRAAFVQKAGFLKKWFPGSVALDKVKAYIAALRSSGNASEILIVGDQFNGGYAKKLSAELNISFVAFNPPGTKYMHKSLKNGVQLSSVRSLWSYIDSLEDTVDTVYYSCSSKFSSNRCGRISTVLSYLLEFCGDATGRSMNQV